MHCEPGRRTNRSVFGAIEHIEKNFREHISLDDLATVAGLSVFRFARLFRQQVGISPYRYLCRIRVRHAQALMEKGWRPSVIAIEVGFFDQSHLARHFKKICGITPSQYMLRIKSDSGASINDSLRLCSAI